MSLTIEIAGDLEPLLKAEAGKAGVAPEEYTSRLLRNSLLKQKSNAPVLSPQEARLLNEINQGLSAEEIELYVNLVRRRQEEAISAAGFDELRRLTHKLEKIGISRAEKLAKLAEFRGVSMERLIDELELRAPDVL